jgi:hypothetical protein
MMEWTAQALTHRVPAAIRTIALALLAVLTGFGLTLPWHQMFWLWFGLAAVIVAGTALALGWRPAVLALCLCLVPPGVIGENSGAVGIALFLVILITIGTASVEIQSADWQRWIPSVFLGLEGLAWATLALSLGAPGQRGAFIQAVLFCLAALTLYVAHSRPSTMTRALRGLAWLLALFCFSYLLSYSLGFQLSEARNLPLEYRSLEMYPPATLVSRNVGFMWPSLPRFAALSGEPGLAAILFLVGIWSAIALEHGYRRVVLIGLLAAGSLFTQSTGLFVALLVLAVGAAVHELARRVNLATAAVCGVVGCAVVVGVLDWLLRVKMEGAAESAATRGFELAGGILYSPATAPTNIALLPALARQPLVAIPLIALLVFLCLTAVRHPLTLGLVLAIGGIALFAQPLQYGAGAWVLVGTTVAIANLSRTADLGT